MPFQDKYEHVPLPILLDRYNIRLKQKWGQNFLSDRNLLKKITAAANIKAGDLVVEVGCGAGALTACLAQAGARVAGVEIDERLGPLLHDRFASNEQVHITFADALTLNLKDLATALAGPGLAEGARTGQLKIVSNVPYYITTDLVTHFFLSLGQVGCIVLLVQQEAAAHFTATGGKQYGPLTGLAQTYGRVESLFQIPPGAFTPPPTVRSTVLRLTADQVHDPIGWENYPAFYRLLQACFQQRRKTLTNNLKKTGYLSDEKSTEILRCLKSDFQLPDNCRAEECPPAFFAALQGGLKQPR